MKEWTPYRPSNSTEYGDFTRRYCDRCLKNSKQGCLIAARSMLFDETDPEYPKQWRYANGRPTCTAFESREDHRARRVTYAPRVPKSQMRLL